MAHKYELLRLMFETNKTKKTLEYAPANLVVKTRANTGSKCKTGQDDFNYERSMIAVAIDKNLLQQKAKKITSKRIKTAVKEIIENNEKVISSELSA